MHESAALEPRAVRGDGCVTSFRDRAVALLTQRTANCFTCEQPAPQVKTLNSMKWRAVHNGSHELTAYGFWSIHALASEA